MTPGRALALTIAVAAVAAVYGWHRLQRAVWARTTAGHRCDRPPEPEQPEQQDPTPLPTTAPFPATGMMALGGCGAAGPDVRT